MIKILQILVVNLPLVGDQNIYSEAAQLEAKQHLTDAAMAVQSLCTHRDEKSYKKWNDTQKIIRDVTVDGIRKFNTVEGD